MKGRHEIQRNGHVMGRLEGGIEGGYDLDTLTYMHLYEKSKQLSTCRRGGHPWICRHSVLTRESPPK